MAEIAVTEFKIKKKEKEKVKGLWSQESPSALSGATAAEQHLPLHAAHLVVVVPRQLRAGPDPPARVRRGGKVSDRSGCWKHLNLNLNVTASGLCLRLH